MIIHSYCSSGGKDLILAYINGLQTEEKVDGLSVLEDLEKGRLSGLQIYRWQGKVYEVYFKKHNRIFYVSMDKDNIYLLHACKKQKNKTEKTDSIIVIKRAKELGELLGKKII